MGLYETLVRNGPEPGNKHVRLLRAVFGLCPDCDNEEPHEHNNAEGSKA